MMSKGLDAESISRIEDPLIQLGLCIYIVKDTTSSPLIVLDKRKDGAVESWNREVFSHLAHPDDLWTWQTGLDMEVKRYQNHDSFCCRESVEDLLYAAMQQAWKDVLGSDTFCKISKK